MCNLQAGGQAVKHLSELVKCFVFIYKALNHKTDPNKLNRSEWWTKVYEACKTVKVGSGRVCRLHLTYPAVEGWSRLDLMRNVIRPILFPPAVEPLTFCFYVPGIKLHLNPVLLKIFHSFSLTFSTSNVSSAIRGTFGIFCCAWVGGSVSLLITVWVKAKKIPRTFSVLSFY